MTKTVAAIYENGMLKLPEPLPLPDKTPVTVTIESELAVAEDTERAVWLKASESALTKTWDNSADDVFNELLPR
jgi:predicted DNA-binding antitoxin AbrB/MazE fold protein